MKKKIIILLFILLFMTSCSKGTSDALIFKDEYESLNSKSDILGNSYRQVSIPVKNPMVYKTALEIVDYIENRESFVIYFGYNTCAWCRNVVPMLIKAANDTNIKEVYYVDISSIRDTLSLNEDNEIVTIKSGDENYLKLLELLDNVLDDYELEDEEKNKIDTGEKRIMAPNIIVVKDGVAESKTTGIPVDLVDPYIDLSDEENNKIYKKIIDVFNSSNENICTKDQQC